MKKTMNLVTIGWRDAVTAMDQDVSVDEVMASDALTRARKHLAIEVGAPQARKAASALRARLNRMAAEAAKRGERLQIHVQNQTDSCPTWDTGYGLGVLVRAIADDRITWSLLVTSSGYEAPRIARGMRRSIGRHRSPIKAIVARSVRDWNEHIVRACEMHS